ncbi:DEK protein, partial [Amia calva]|nr:DEK protein [Amia calva]
MKSPELKPLHKLLYNRPGAVATLKKNLRQFRGFTFEKDSDPYKKKQEMLKRYTIVVLKNICGILDLEKSGRHDDIIDRILTFLLKPSTSGKPLPKAKKSRAKKREKKVKRGSPKKNKAKVQKKSDAIVIESSSEEEERRDKAVEPAPVAKSAEMVPPKKVAKTAPAAVKKKPPTKSANVKKADSSSTKKTTNIKSKGGGQHFLLLMLSILLAGEESEHSSDDEPLIKILRKPPTEDQLRETVKKLLETANLEEVTMKQLCKKVNESYPDHDLSDKKEYIKKTVKEVSSCDKHLWY